ncbi:MAG: glycosyltransferase family 4 protein [archaeon]
MKIGVLITYFHPFKDGTENQALYWSAELAKPKPKRFRLGPANNGSLGKHEVHIFTSDRKEGTILKEKYELYRGLHIHRYKTIFRYRYYLCWNQKLILDLLASDLDVLLVHSIGFPQQDLAVLLLKLLKPKLRIVNFPHGPFLANKNIGLPIKILKYIYRLAERPVNRLYDAVIDCNGGQKETWMPEYFPDLGKVRYCPDGIPADRFRKISSLGFEKKYGLKNRFVVAQLGRLTRYKGQEQVIKVLPEILEKHKNVVFLLIGPDKGYKKELEQLAKTFGVEKNVIFAGEVSEDDKLRALDLSEIICFTSMPGTEAFGIVLLEGMARKCAGISTKVEGGNTAVIHEKNGFVYDHNDLPSLKEYLLKLIENKSLLKKMQKSSFDRARGFVNESIVWKYLEPILDGKSK